MSNAAVPFDLGAAGEASALRLGDALFGRKSQPKSPKEALQPQSAPPPPPPPPRKRHRSSPFLSAASGILSLLVIVAIGAALLDATLQHTLRTAGPLPADKIVVIPPGSPPGDIADQLEAEGIIDSKWMFNLAALRENVRSSLRHGEYKFKQFGTLQDTIDVLVKGKAIQHALTIPEGLTSEQIVARVRENEILVGDVREVPKEGTLLPETYNFGRGMTRDQILQKMAKDQKAMLDEIWKKRAADIPVKSSWELVTLASIVEKETGKADERPHVASVFANRLVKGMKLQSDPTIIYGIVGGKGTLGRGITRKEIEQATPFNTYVIAGLPPGPIANPGRAAMEAVANPLKTKDLFFVADGSGGHAFAETLDQHNKNVLRWRDIEKDAKDKYQPGDPATAAPAPAPAPPPGTKGEIDRPDGNAYGAIPAEAASPSGAAAPVLPVTAGLDALRGALTARAGRLAGAGAPATQTAPLKAAAAAGGYAMGPMLSDLAGKLPGLSAYAPDPELDADGSVTPGALMQTYPVSPARLADQKARAALYGVPPAAVSAPRAAPEPAPGDITFSAQAAPAPAPRTRVVAIDASAGTALDPLRNRSFDLTSAKTVPPLK